jgi:hypothetical protein
MNESVLDRPALYAQVSRTFGHGRPRTTPFQWYLLLAATVVLGWLLRDHDLIDASEGLGYWLGIAGGSLMLVVLLYPLRKRFRILHILGETRHWFRLHIVLGLVGPLLILYHCNFRLGSLNSQVALYCMLLVAGSGIVGRHFHARIHRDLHGSKTSLRELQSELTGWIQAGHGLARLMPNLVRKLDAMSAELQGGAVVQSLGVGHSLRWTLTHRFTYLMLRFTAWRELRRAAGESPVVARNRRGLRLATTRYIRDYTAMMGRVAQFSMYERLFAIWHILHLPIFFMMVLSAVVHVLAVHMY